MKSICGWLLATVIFSAVFVDGREPAQPLHTNSRDSSFRDDQTPTLSKRKLLQRREIRYPCELSRRQQLQLRNSRGEWIVNVTDLEEVDGDLQRIMNCTEPDDVVLLNITELITLTRALVIPWNLTLSGYVRNANDVEGVFPKARRNARFSCTTGDGALSVLTRNARLANLEFAFCRQREHGPAVIEVRNCSGGNEGRLQLHHVMFLRNRHRGGPIGISLRRPSCITTELVDVQFLNNTCGHRCLATLGPYNSFRNVEITGNSWRRLWPLSDPALIWAPLNNHTELENVDAVNNEGSVFWIVNGTVNVLNSTFERNRGGRTSEGFTFSGSFTLANASGLIQNSTFVRNSADAGAGLSVFSSSLELEDCTFEQNQGLPVAGGVFVSDLSTANFSNCKFIRNKADEYGAAALINVSSVVNFTDSVFRFNQAGESGTLFIEESTLFMENCSFFQNNASTSGGAAMLQDSVGDVSNSTFVENSAVERGGAWSSSQTAMQFSNCNFTNNEVVESGGGLAHEGRLPLAIIGCTFLKNYGQNAAGIFFNSPNIMNMADSVFNGNEVSGGGGGVLTGDSSVLVFSNCVYFNNSATHGAGIKLGTDNHLNLTASEFNRNHADESGSGIFADVNCTQLVDSCTFSNGSNRFGAGIRMVRDNTLTVNNSLFQWNSVERNGGAIYSDERVKLVIGNSTFLHNSADHGGAVHTTTDGEVSINSSVFRNNTAVNNGGGIYIGNNAQVSLTNLSFFENFAIFGAALDIGSNSELNCVRSVFSQNRAGHTSAGVFAKFSIVNISECEFVHNHGGEGCGAVYFEACNATVQSCSIRDNTAGTAGGGFLTYNNNRTDLLSTVFRGNSAPRGGAFYSENSFAVGRNLSFLNNSAQIGGSVDLNISSSLLCRNCVFLRNSASEDGGAVFMDSVDHNGVAYQFENSTFRENEAQFGGALHILQGEGGTQNCSSADANCSYLILSGSTLVDNIAQRAGGAILSNNAGLVRFSCDLEIRDNLSFIGEEEFERWALLDPNSSCENWGRNSVRRGGYGGVYGTFAQEVLLTLVYQNGTEESINRSEYRFANTKSGVPLPQINLEANDAFGAGPAIAQVKDLGVSLSSPDGFFPGDITINMSTGNGTFAELLSFREPGDYHLHINFTDPALKNFTIVVNIRRCRIGEEETARGNFCQECDATSYNFFPGNESCQQCPDNANCSGSLVFSENGFWNRHPCSRHIQECITTPACDYEGRSDKLFSLSQTFDSCIFESIESLEDYSIAMCKEGYSGVLCGSCQDDYGLSGSFECQKCRPTLISIMLAIFSTIWVLFLSAIAVRGGLSVKLHEPSFLAERFPSEESVVSETPVNLEMVEMMIQGRIPPERFIERRQGPPAQALTPDQIINRLNLTKWRCAEIFKITINYLQIVGIAVTVNTDWSETIIDFLRTVEAVSGFASEAANRSIDCIAPNDSSVPKSVVRTMVALAVPLVSFACLSFLWLLIKIKKEFSNHYLFRRIALSLLAVLYISYIAVTKTVIRILYCVEVYDSFDLASDQTTEYWAMDTSLKCYEGSHLVMTILFSFPCLLLVTIAYPVVSATILLFCKSKGNLRSTRVFETMGFMFRAYKERYVFWESIVLLRKGLLSIIVVFAYPLGGNLQGTLAVAVLLLASYLHNVCQPFSSEFDELNDYEGLSLLVSSLTFVVGFFFNDDKTSDGIRVTLTAFLLISNIGLFIFFLTMFFLRALDHMHTRLYPNHPISHTKVFSLISNYASLQLNRFQVTIHKMTSV